jgi:hypothetical protein
MNYLINSISNLVIILSNKIIEDNDKPVKSLQHLNNESNLKEDEKTNEKKYVKEKEDTIKELHKQLTEKRIEVSRLKYDKSLRNTQNKVKQFELFASIATMEYEITKLHPITSKNVKGYLGKSEKTKSTF